MSASASKKRRKEELLAKQAVPAKKEKKSNTAKKIVLGIIAAVVAVALIITIGLLIKGQRYKPDYDVSQPAMVVGDYEITVPMFNCFYTSQLNNDYSYALMSQYGMLSHGVPLSQQQMLGSEYVDDMITQTKTMITNTVNVYLEAKKEGYTLTEEDQKAIDESVSSLKEAARKNGYNFFGLTYDWFCSDYFGMGTTLQTYKDYVELMQYCAGFEKLHEEDFEPSADEIAAEYAANPDDYDVVCYTLYTVSAESDGQDSAGTATYSEDALNAAKEKADAAAKNFPEEGTSFVSRSFSNASSSNGEDAAKWLFSADRKAGDISVFSTSNKVTYYVMRYEERDTNDYNLINCYLTSFPFDAEGAELEEGQIAAADTFKKLSDGVKDGMSEDDFTALLASCGLEPSSRSVDRHSQPEAVTDFLFDSSRKDGDVFTFTDEDAGVYYVIRFNSAEEDTYQTTLVKNALHEAAESAWLKDIYDNYTAEITDDALVNAYTDRMVY